MAMVPSFKTSQSACDVSNHGYPVSLGQSRTGYLRPPGCKCGISNQGQTKPRLGAINHVTVIYQFPQLQNTVSMYILQPNLIPGDYYWKDRPIACVHTQAPTDFYTSITDSCTSTENGVTQCFNWRGVI